jgi:hypothetical protein
MFIHLRREVALPAWALAVGVAAFSAPPAVIPSLVALLGLTLAGSAALAIVERLRRPHSPCIDVLPPLELERAADLNRMDSDKG